MENIMKLNPFTQLLLFPIPLQLQDKFKTAIVVVDKSVSPLLSLGVMSTNSTILKISTYTKKFFDFTEIPGEILTKINSITFLCSYENLKKTDLTQTIIHISNAILLPFSVVDIIEEIKPLNFVHDFFKKAPVLSGLEYAGITNFAGIAINSSSLIKFYYLSEKLSQELTSAKEAKKIKDLELQIKLNRINLAEKTIKTAASVFYLATAVIGSVNPAIKAVKISCIAVELICNVGRVHLMTKQAEAA